MTPVGVGKLVPVVLGPQGFPTAKPAGTADKDGLSAPVAHKPVCNFLISFRLSTAMWSDAGLSPFLSDRNRGAFTGLYGHQVLDGIGEKTLVHKNVAALLLLLI